jgi:cytochrome c oxidase subunit 2
MNEFLRRLLFLPEQASTVSKSIDHLHYFVIITTMVGATVITFVGGWFLIRYRRRNGEATRQTEAPHAPAWMELGMVALLLSLFVGWWGIGFVQYVRMRVPPPNTLDIYLTAKQWMWKFAYSDGHHSIAVLYVPAGRPVKLIMTSRDVIHSFYVPDFRVKQDVVPGRYTTVWFQADRPGTHDILCAEYCGANHSTMRGQVVVLDPADYERWLESGRVAEDEGPRYVEPSVVGELAPAEPMELAKQGVQVAARAGCLRCHTLDGTPHIGPTWAGLYRSTVQLTNGATVVADEAYLTESMMDPMVKIVAGYQPVMPSFQGRIDAGETAALVELIKSLSGGEP